MKNSLSGKEIKVDLDLPLSSLFCKILDFDNKLIIEKDESYLSKPYLYPAKWLIFGSILCIILSVLCLIFSLTNVTFNTLFFIFICYCSAHWFISKYRYYKGRTIEIIIDKEKHDIIFRQILPDDEDLGRIFFSDVYSIMFLIDYLNPGKCHIAFLLNSFEKIKIYNGKEAECERFGNLISKILNKPILYKETLKKPVFYFSLVFIILFISSFLFGDLIAMVFFLLSLIILNILYDIIILRLSLLTKFSQNEYEWVEYGNN